MSNAGRCAPSRRPTSRRTTRYYTAVNNLLHKTTRVYISLFPPTWNGTFSYASTNDNVYMVVVRALVILTPNNARRGRGRRVSFTHANYYHCGRTTRARFRSSTFLGSANRKYGGEKKKKKINRKKKIRGIGSGL